MTENEIWKPVDGYPGYEVSNLGRVRSVERYVTYVSRWGTKAVRKWPSRILSTKCTGWYAQISFGRGTKYKLHRIVAAAFLPNPDNLPEVNHINGVKSDNRASNLEWCDRRRNLEHARISGLIKRPLTPHQVRAIRAEIKAKKLLYREIAAKYGVTLDSVQGLASGSYRDIE